MARLSRHLPLLALLLPATAHAQANLPWADAVGHNPQRLLQVVTDAKALVDPAGITMVTDLVPAIVANPDRMVTMVPDPSDAESSATIAALLGGRNAVLANGAAPMPANVRTTMLAFFTPELLDTVRWSTRWDVVQNLPPDARLKTDRDGQATTLINTIVFKDRAAIDDVSLWAHQLYHVQQLKDWGIFAFARRLKTATFEVERQAALDESRIRELLTARSQSLTQPVADAAVCVEAGPSVAACDLYAAFGKGAVEFTVSGSARATGAAGSMLSLALVAGEHSCNARAADKVAVGKAVELGGEGFSCTLTLAPGESRRVWLIAPNTKAQPVFTRGVVTVKRAAAQ